MELVLFVLKSAALGVGLAMDAFSVSMANGLNETNMKLRKMIYIAGTFAFFQIAMPLIGWLCVHTIVETFTYFQRFIPFIALGLLGYIGGKMLIEGLKGEEAQEEAAVDFKSLMIQGVATSIDALSVGFTISEYSALSALSASIIIGIVTFIICMFGLKIGKKVGMKLSSKASILGGVILILIGLEIFIGGVF